VGWRIQSWEGLLTTAVFAVLMVIGSILGRSRWVGLPLLLLAYGVVVLLTGDPPGGPAGPGESGSHDTTS
jgi:O-antigen ligase